MQSRAVGRWVVLAAVGMALALVPGQGRAGAKPEILFTNYFGDVGRIFVMDADGSNQTLLFPSETNPSQWKESALAWVDWSPDGKKIIFEQITKGEVWVIDVTDGNGAAVGSNPRLYFTDSPGASPNPRWSSLGTQIAIGRSITGGHQIWIVPTSARDGCPDPLAAGRALTPADLEAGCGDPVSMTVLNGEGKR